MPRNLEQIQENRKTLKIKIGDRISVLPVTKIGEMISKECNALCVVTAKGFEFLKGNKRFLFENLKPDFVINQVVRKRNLKMVTYRGMPVEMERQLIWER